MTNLRQLEYLAKGWSIVPVPQGMKFPSVKWKEFQTRLPTEAEVRKWWTDDPTANTAIVTGALSGVCTIDVDGPVGRENAKALNLPCTLTVKTGRADGGEQFWFKHPGVPVRTCAGEIAEHIDVRGDGGLAIIPYSIHATGRIYAWVGGFGAINQQLAPFPKNVLEMLGRNASEQEYQSVPTAQEPWVTELLKGVGEGEKHQALIRLAGYFNSKGLPKDVAVSLLLDWNTRNKPPADANGIIERVEDVYKRYSPSISGRTANSVGVEKPLVSSTTPAAAYRAFKAELVSGVKTIPTGISTLDRYTRGLLRGNLTVIGAWPGVGKTAFTLGLARSIAESGKTVAYFPTEMFTNELLRVFIASGLSIPFKSIMDGSLTEDEHARVEAYLTGEVLSRLHIVPVTSPTLQDIEQAVKTIKPDLVVLDYIQHTKGSGDKRQHIEELVIGLKKLAQDVDAAILITSQFRRPYRDNDGKPVKPTMFDFSDCAQIEREVSTALLMSPLEIEEGHTVINLEIGKGRFGGVGQNISLNFDTEFVRFSE